MKLDGIIPLYRSMQSQQIERYHFEYKAGKVIFDVFIFLDSDPYLLLFGVKIHNFCFELQMQRGFIINPNLDPNTYKKLCKILGLTFDPNKPFSTQAFFKEFNSCIPKIANIANTIKPHDLSPYRSDVEEADKRYFIGWRDNTRWGTNVTDLNLDKTRKWLGEQAYLRCQQRNISSCWSADASAATNVILP